MRRALIPLAALIVAMGCLGFLYAWAGLYNVGASSGHWPVTRWFLHFALTNSIETHAIGIEPPPLDKPSLFHKGLRHYDGACAPCHGTPEKPRNPVAGHMLPLPPYLPDTLGAWDAAELFWIVKNGLKYTGMPAWIARDRDDEVWAVVAFLRRLPGLGAEEYLELSRPPDGDASGRSIEESARLIASAGPVGDDLIACARCHGLTGNGGGAGAFPRLAGQNERYLLQSLRSYADGSRPSGLMQPVAADLTDEEIRKLAAFYAAAEPARASPNPPLPAMSRLGETIAMEGLPDRGVPACAACHGPDRPAAGAELPYPRLDGQFADYLVLQLGLWRDGRRGSGPYSDIMTAAAQGLTDEEIAAVAAYYAGRPTNRTEDGGPEGGR